MEENAIAHLGFKLGRKSINGMAAFMEGGRIRGKIFSSLGIFVDTNINIVPGTVCAAVVMRIESNLDLAFISVPHFLKVRIFWRLHDPDLVILIFSKFLSKFAFMNPRTRFQEHQQRWQPSNHLWNRRPQKPFSIGCRSYWPGHSKLSPSAFRAALSPSISANGGQVVPKQFGWNGGTVTPGSYWANGITTPSRGWQISQVWESSVSKISIFSTPKS